MLWSLWSRWTMSCTSKEEHLQVQCSQLFIKRWSVGWSQVFGTVSSSLTCPWSWNGSCVSCHVTRCAASRDCADVQFIKWHVQHAACYKMYNAFMEEIMCMKRIKLTLRVWLIDVWMDANLPQRCIDMSRPHNIFTIQCSNQSLILHMLGCFRSCWVCKTFSTTQTSTHLLR